MVERGDGGRQDRARFIVQGARGWIKVRTKDGKPLALGIPSSSRPGLVHLANTRTCTCVDSKYGNWCYHSRAVRLWVDRLNAQRVAA